MIFSPNKHFWSFSNRQKIKRFSDLPTLIFSGMLAETKLFSFFRPKIQRLLQALEVVWVIIFHIDLQAYLRILVFSCDWAHISIWPCILVYFRRVRVKKQKRRKREKVKRENRCGDCSSHNSQGNINSCLQHVIGYGTMKEHNDWKSWMQNNACRHFAFGFGRMKELPPTRWLWINELCQLTILNSKLRVIDHFITDHYSSQLHYSFVIKFSLHLLPRVILVRAMGPRPLG